MQEKERARRAKERNDKAKEKVCGTMGNRLVSRLGKV